MDGHISGLLASAQERKSHLSLNENVLEDGPWKLRPSVWKAGEGNPAYVCREWGLSDSGGGWLVE